MTVSLKIIEENSRERRLAIHTRQIVIGRSSDCDLVIPTEGVSRRHARIFLQGERWFVEDLGSRNGTWLNGRRLLAQTAEPVCDSDEVLVHSTRLVFQPRDEVAVQGTQPSQTTWRGQVIGPQACDQEGLQVVTSVDVIQPRLPTDVRDAETRLKAILELTQNIGSSAGLEQLVRTILANVVRVLPQVACGAILIRTDDGESLIPMAVHGDDSIHVNALESIKMSIVRRTIQSASAVLCEERLERTDSGQCERHIMCAPLTEASGYVLGVIYLHSSHGLSFGDDDLGLLAVMASLASRTIEHSRHNEARFRSVVNTAPDAIVTTDLNGRIQFINPAGERLFGYSPGTLTGRPIDDIIGSPQAGSENVANGDVHDLDPALPSERVGYRSDGNLFSVLVSAGEAPRGGFRTIVIQDITGLKKTEDRLRRANNLLRARNSELQRLLASLSHDLRTPLITCQAWAGVLTEDVMNSHPERALEAAGRIQKASQRMYRLLDELERWDAFERTPGNVQRVDVDRIVRDVISGCLPARNPAQATIVIEGRLGEIPADPRHVSEVFLHLITNALQHGCRGDNPQIVIGASIHDREAHFYVRDSGPGIPAEYQQQIFGLFERLETRAGGTGSGLATVARIMHGCDGRAWVESKPGQGATFWVAFPLDNEDTLIMADAEPAMV